MKKAGLMKMKGVKNHCTVRLWAQGDGGHVSAPGDDQAIVKLARAIETVFMRQDQLKEGDQDVLHVSPFTIGERNNVLPEQVDIVLEFVVSPTVGEDDIRAYLHQALAGVPADYEVLSFLTV